MTNSRSVTLIYPQTIQGCRENGLMTNIEGDEYATKY
jgi:hypothetical protein